MKRFWDKAEAAPRDTGFAILLDGRPMRLPDGAVLAVHDTGYGIPAQHLPRITERFYRVSTSRSRESGGTGLGLSIVKHVIALHQARLEIASEVGQGSTFAIHFGSTRVQPRNTQPMDIA